MKIRIGTDLNLLVNISSAKDPGTINIRSLEAYLINTTYKEKIDKEIEKKTKFISRFPIEPMRDAYLSTEYNINCSGYPRYHVHPSYAGFGVNPTWNLIYPIKPDHRYTEYKAKAYATSAVDTVLITFPAEDQLFCGDYNIVIVAKYYKPGYTNNLKTVTMDFKDAFSLVDSTEQEDTKSVNSNVRYVDGGTQLAPGVDGGTQLVDVYVNAGNVTKDSEGKSVVHLDWTLGGSGVDINVSEEFDWYDGD